MQQLQEQLALVVDPDVTMTKVRPYQTAAYCC